ncbi:MAG: hypothetical protein H7A55_03480 [Verrucomicrobiaceae bacterium]|nr:hypothetical protein [Verrucomicrobiaceae bacterium]
MIPTHAIALIAVLWAAPALHAEKAFGFGSSSRGGEGGNVLMVTRLDDDVRQPKPGMLRWALTQPGPRIIRFGVAGTISLKDRIIIRQGRVTVDGRDAPALGVCIRGGSLEFEGCSDIILRNFRVRLGDDSTIERNRREKRKRPKNSSGLDCIGLRDCRRVLLDHLSLSWCCDELLSVVRCQEVTAQWCIFAEPLSNWKLHPYGDNHAFALNASASTLTVYRCLFAHYIMRGPQFEANDIRKKDRWNVKMEAIGNVMFDYQRSGSRYTAGVEDHKSDAVGKSFQFQFIANEYIAGDASQNRPVEIIIKHGTASNVRVGIDDNGSAILEGPTPASKLCITEDGKRLTDAPSGAQKQIRNERIFTSPNPPPAARAFGDWQRFLATVGCSHARDFADARIIEDIVKHRNRDPISSQDKVGGWPDLDGNKRSSVGPVELLLGR